MSFGPRVWFTTSALTDASATRGRPIVESSPSATSRTRSIVIVLPGSTSSSSTSSSVPTSTRYCFPPLSMTAYMDPQDWCLATARGDRDIGHEMARGEADAQKAKCTTVSTKRSITQGLESRRVAREDQSFPDDGSCHEGNAQGFRERRDHLARPARAELRVELGPRPQNGRRAGGNDLEGVDEGTEVVGDGLGSLLALAGQGVGREEGRRSASKIVPIPSRPRDAVVGGADLSCQGGCSEPDIVEVHQPPARRQYGLDCRANAPRRLERAQDDVGELCLGHKACWDRRRESHACSGAADGDERRQSRSLKSRFPRFSELAPAEVRRICGPREHESPALTCGSGRRKGCRRGGGFGLDRLRPRCRGTVGSRGRAIHVC